VRRISTCEPEKILIGGWKKKEGKFVNEVENRKKKRREIHLNQGKYVSRISPRQERGLYLTRAARVGKEKPIREKKGVRCLTIKAGKKGESLDKQKGYTFTGKKRRIEKRDLQVGGVFSCPHLKGGESRHAIVPGGQKLIKGP